MINDGFVHFSLVGFTHLSLSLSLFGSFKTRSFIVGLKIRLLFYDLIFSFIIGYSIYSRSPGTNWIYPRAIRPQINRPHRACHVHK